MSVGSRKYRLRSCIAIVVHGQLVEFFDSNIRTGFSIELDYPNVTELLHKFDGSLTILDIGILYPEIDFNELLAFVQFLHDKRVLIEVDEDYPEAYVNFRPRLINTLETFFGSTSDVNKSISQGMRKNIFIIGLGAVGTWVLHCLVKAGVQNITVMDDDNVEISNIHRQDLFFEGDIGTSKVDAARSNIKNAYGIEIETVCKRMENIEDIYSLKIQPDLIINCADYPSVDFTSRLVSDFCLKYRIPHIIGGGYNLHLTLVGQVIIPGVTACLHCFDKALSSANTADLFGVKKLNRKNRKTGSLGPVCAISASITATEAIKIVFDIPLQHLAVINKRLEFSLANFDFGNFPVERNPDCSHCGQY